MNKRIFLSAGMMLAFSLTSFCIANNNKPFYFGSLIEEGGLAAVKQLIEKEKMDINALDDDNYTLLITAVSTKDLKLVLYLLEHGADVNAVSQEIETEWGDWAIQHTRSPLHVAVVDGNTELMRVLLDHGARIDIQNNKGETPLHWAVLINEPKKIIPFLIASGANINAKDHLGNTPLHEAALNDAAEETIQLLLDGNADINAQNNDGETPLHAAMQHYRRLKCCNPDPVRLQKCHSVIQLLVARGANCAAQTKQGKTALDLAQDLRIKLGKHKDERLNAIIDLLKST